MNKRTSQVGSFREPGGIFRRLFSGLPALFLLTLFVAACGGPQRPAHLPPADPENGGLWLPDGFEAVVVADSIGPARHIWVAENGDIYVKLRQSFDDGTMVALRDTDGDGKADIIEKFGIVPSRGNYHTGVKIHNGYLYFSTNLHVYRYKINPGELVPDTTTLETLVIDDHERQYHAHQTKPFAFDGRGNMYVAFGAPSDACQNPDRTPGVPGQDPCPELEDHGGIWVFDENKLNQTQADGRLYASGLRSVVAMEWHPVEDELFAMQHGRDYLFRQWPEYFSRWDSAVLPSEEFVRATDGSHFGWPYCYYDQLKERKLLNPEYGGDSEIVGRCAEFDDPEIGFPGHFAPNGLHFYTGDQFPEYFRNGAFFAFHGSTIRNPYPQAGYFVAFSPYVNGGFDKEWLAFANGFAQVDPIVNTSDAQGRPMGLAMGPDGSLYITETVKGKIWRVMYVGDKSKFGQREIAQMKEEKETASNIKYPDPEADNLEKEIVLGGEQVYRTYCAACHGRTGQGSPPRFPPIAETDWVSGDKERLIRIVLEGLQGPIEVKGVLYNSAMPAHSFMEDSDIAELLTFIRSNFGNTGDAVTEEEVSAIRARIGN